MRLINYLPPYYENSLEMVAFQETLGIQSEQLIADFDSLCEQLHVQTATYGLEYWERALGLSVDISKPMGYRRTRIISKLRGSGTTTVAMIKNVAESFSNGQVEVIELNAEYGFDVKFVGTIGIPPNMEDLTAAIDEIKPAHLSYKYIIIFRTYGELAPYTNGALTRFTHEQLRQGGLDNARNTKI